MTYIPTIGLEIHAELKTKSKMFCGCPNDPDEPRPNHTVCPICMGHPGTLPVINREAVRHMVRIGTAVGGTIADFTEFDRKNYFYPDIPKGYQISQYEYPLVVGGSINGIALTRIHLEEDTASSLHEDAVYSNLNFNRAGVPLMELVTEPVIHDATLASAFARELRTLLRTLGASGANMEKGEMRVEANVSVAQEGAPLGTKVEVKNLNSFRSVERAIAYEIQRHIALLEKGEKIVQETSGWDEAGQKTFTQRVKEEAQEYRYFPDPDLPKLRISRIPEFTDDKVRATLPELPWETRARLVGKLGISAENAELLVQDVALLAFFDEVCTRLKGDSTRIRLAVNYLTSDVLGLVQEGVASLGAIIAQSPAEFAALIDMVADNTVSSRGAKDTLRAWVVEGGDPHAIAEREGLLQVDDDDALGVMAEEIVAEHQAVVEEYRAGKEASLQFLVGQGMKRSKGSANPVRLRELLIAKIAD